MLFMLFLQSYIPYKQQLNPQASFKINATSSYYFQTEQIFNYYSIVLNL